MAVLICKMCGGDLEITEGMTTVKCPYCGTNQTLPKLDSEKRLRLYDRANHFRRNNDYDKAMAVYEQILSEDQTDSEAYWSIVLCRYGIEYVEDPASHQRIPTVNRTQYTSVFADEDYKAALRYADVVQKRIYEKEAETIDAIQRSILQISGQEDRYDIFICYKETGEDGNRTRESVLANELYYQLTREGYKVFCARITLEDKPGTAYEPYIFAALGSARVMVVLGTTPEHFQSPWVRNEWERYLSLIRQGEKKVLIPAYRDMDPYDLPKEFSHLQALDMAKLGFAQDLVHGIKKILDDDIMRSGTLQNAALQSAAPQSAGKSIKADALSLSGAKGIDYQVTESRIRKTGWEAYGWKRGVLLGVIFVLAMLLINGKGIYNRWQMDHGGASENGTGAEKAEIPTVSNDLQGQIFLPQTEETEGRNGIEGTDGIEGIAAETDFTGLLAQFLFRLYECPAEDVTDAQLAKIRQLSIKRDWDAWQVGYSYEAPAQNVAENTADGLTWMCFSAEEELQTGSLFRFSELKSLDVDTVVSPEDIKGLPLESISAYFENPAEAAEVLEYPEAVKALGFNADVESLDGLETFENLETLFIDYLDADNLDALIHAGHLKKLMMACDEALTDFTVLGKLSDLERISLEAEGLKTLDFVSGLKNLESLEITGGNLLTLSGLENCATLEELSVTGCMELKDVSAVQELDHLQKLALEVPYGCPEPDLGRLTGLQTLLLDQFQDCSFLPDMTGLKELHLNGCSLPEGMDLSKLTSLKTFSCTYVTNLQLEVSAIEALRTIEHLDLHGVATFEDISGLFEMPNLKELNISGMQCEIDFDAVGENPALEILHMDNMFLYENVWVDYSAGILMADWDEVTFDEHTDFLKKFTGLKELYLAENALTDISFAESLPALEILDISENYITQLRPLAGLPSLQKVICTGNPLKSEKVLKDSVVIVDDSVE